MTAPDRSAPTWFVVLLAIEVVLALIVSLVLAFVFLRYATTPTSIDGALVVIVSAVPLLVTAGAAALARALWRSAGEGAAYAAAVLPVALGVPVLAFMFGFGL